MSVFGAYAEPESDLFGDKIVRIVKYSEMNFRDKFVRGDVLMLTTYEEDELPRECLVVDVGKNWLTMGVGPTWPTGLWEARKIPGRFPVRLDRSAPQSPMRAQRSALALVRQGKAGTTARYLERLFMVSSEGHEKVAATGYKESEIRLALNQAIQNCASFQPNVSQKNAICWALQRDLSIVRGPPGEHGGRMIQLSTHLTNISGTGKTHVAALLVATKIKLDERSGTIPRVLAVTHSNGAADVLLEALLQVRVPAVRLGRPASVSARVQHRTTAAMAEQHPETIRLRAVARDMSISAHERSSAHRQLQQCANDVQQSIIAAAPVIVASCIGAHQLMNEESCMYSTVVLDEAAQTTEPALMCALASVMAKQVVLVGDTRQLPPTITCNSLRDSLGISPMARLEAIGLPVKMLRLQYRMPTALLVHPSKYFYEGLVKSAETVYEGPPPAGFAWPNNDIPLAFVNIGTDLELPHDFGGKSNPSEARLVLKVAREILFKGDISANNMAIISPYSKQVQTLRSELSSVGNETMIHVGTVDSFQGQETDVVIFSCVRSNRQFDLGFLRDARRLCVTLTRARRGLILIGDVATLQACRHWESLILHCRERNCIVDSSELTLRAKSTVENQNKGLLRNGNFTFDDVLKDIMGNDYDVSDILA